MSKCGSKVPCGCGSTPLSTQAGCGDECIKEPCSELFCEECIIHCQPEISMDLGGGDLLVVENGDRWDTVVQKLMIASAAPECLATAAVGLRLLSKTTTSIKVSWKVVTGSTYSITWTDGVTPVTVDTAALTEYQIINLAPDTEYSITIDCNEDSCASVTLKVKTNI